MKTSIKQKALWLAIFFIILFAIYKTQFGYHFDEIFLIDLGDVILKGTKPISENWIHLQLGGYILLPFYALFKLIFRSYDGIIIFFRLLYVIINIGVSIYIYHTLKKHFSPFHATVIAVINLLFYSGFATIQYKQCLYWFVLLCMLSIINYSDTNKIRYLIFAALSLCAAILFYIGAVIMVIPCAIAICKLHNGNHFRALAVFLGTCAICGSLFLVYVLSQTPFSELCYGFMQILTSDGYSENVIHKLIKVFLPVIIIFIAIHLLLFGSKYLFKKIKPFTSDELFMSIISIAFLIVICAMKPETITVSRVWYCLLLTFCWTPYFLIKKKCSNHNLVIYAFFLPSIFVMVCIAICTNQGIAIVSHGCIMGLYALILLLDKRSILTYTIIGILFISFLYFIPDQNPANATVLTARTKLTSGPAKGIRVTEDVKEVYDELCYLTDTYTDEHDKLLILTTRHGAMGYLNSLAKCAIYSTYYVPLDSEKIIPYYEHNPNQKPSIILLDKEQITSWHDWEQSDVGQYLLSFDYQTIKEDGNYYILSDPSN